LAASEGVLSGICIGQVYQWQETESLGHVVKKKVSDFKSAAKNKELECLR
jgi:hypothetical protein